MSAERKRKKITTTQLKDRTFHFLINVFHLFTCSFIMGVGWCICSFPRNNKLGNSIPEIETLFFNEHNILCCLTYFRSKGKKKKKTV